MDDFLKGIWWLSNYTFSILSSILVFKLFFFILLILLLFVFKFFEKNVKKT
jgi:hypothetical protein